MVGILFKYDAESENEWMKDKRDYDNCQGFSDPDFFTNPFPIWSICGPLIRRSLKKGDVIFFMPKKYCYEAANYTDYLCTGILRVTNFCDKKQIHLIPQIRQEYVTNYLHNLEAHLKQDKIITLNIRPKKIAYGKFPESKWFGKNKISMTDALLKSGVAKRDLTNRVIKHLSENETEKLYTYLMSHCHHEV